MGSFPKQLEGFQIGQERAITTNPIFFFPTKQQFGNGELLWESRFIYSNNKTPSYS